MVAPPLPLRKLITVVFVVLIVALLAQNDSNCNGSSSLISSVSSAGSIAERQKHAPVPDDEVGFNNSEPVAVRHWLQTEPAAVTAASGRSAADEVVYAGCPPMNRTVETIPSSFDATAFCAEFGEQPMKRPRGLVYGMMFSFELDMLEVVLHEASPVVDTFVIVESAWSHSKQRKPLLFRSVLTEPRFRPFLSKLIHGVLPARRLHAKQTGWEYERRQRRRVLEMVKYHSGIQDGDIFIANLDLDEVFSRKTLMRYKFCATRQLHFNSFGYRYNLNCFMDEQMVKFRRGVIEWARKNYSLYDLYKARTAAKAIPLNMSDIAGDMKRVDSQLVWHMSTFGTVEQIRFKLSNSPHRFIDKVSDASLAREMEACEYNNKTRTKLPVLLPHMLPNLVRRNACMYRKKGWITSDVAGGTLSW